MTSSTVWPCAALPDAELAHRTTLRVGGRVEWLLEPATPGELFEALIACRERGVEPRILGGGANLVVDDGVLPGVAIATERLRRVFRPGPEESGGLDVVAGDGPRGDVAPRDPAEDPRLVAWAGCTLPALLRAARELGYSGLEGLVGVPGQVGGGVAMNAGGRWGDMWDVVERVWVVDDQCRLRELPREECRPHYRDGGLGGAVVLAALMRFTPRPRAAVRERMKEYLLEKNRVQPVSEWSAGCIFRNPDRDLSGGRSAGELVEHCGGKALSRGDAVVSPLHANFIVNRGRATALDVLTLMEDLRDLVAQKTGVRLDFEVRRWLRP